MLKPLSEAPVQAYLDNRLQLYDTLEFVLQHTGPAHVAISTFSTSEEFLRRLFRLRSQGQILSAVLLTDLKASKKTLNLYQFMHNVFDRVHLADNHSKIALIHNEQYAFAIVTSQNQTRGNRWESTVICNTPSVYTALHDRFYDIVEHNSIALDTLLRRAD